MGTLEHEAHAVAQTWNLVRRTDRTTGQAAGYPAIQTTTEITDSAASGGAPNSLAVITVTSFEDANGDGRRDANEPAVTFATKIARFISYRFEADGS